MHFWRRPLSDCNVEKGKCGFKAIQYLSLGIPAVVSPVGANTDIVEDEKNGFVASTADEWVKAIEKLYTDGILRKMFGDAGRKKIAAEYSVNSSFKTFLGLFS